MDTIIRNIVLGLALAAPIGPAGIAVMNGGLNHGFINAFLTGLGITMADTTYLLVVFFGLSSFMEQSKVKIVLWVLGAIVLMYLGFQSIKVAMKEIELGRKEEFAGRNPFLSGYVVNISNPIAVVFWVGIFGSMLEDTENTHKVVALLNSSTILIGILIWHSTMSIISSWGKQYLNERVVKYISVMAGIALVLFGMKFAYNVVTLVSKSN